MTYFNSLPKQVFKRPRITDGNEIYQPYTDVVATDITVRFKIREAILSQTSLFYPYRWKDGDRPDTVAEMYYGSASFFWVVFFSNRAFDLFYDFPMTPSQFEGYMVRKYWKQTITDSGKTADQFKALSPTDQYLLVHTYTNSNIVQYQVDGFNVDLDTYISADADRKQNLSLFEVEVNNNEAKRNIKLLDNSYVSQIVTEFNKETATLRNIHASLKRQYGEV